MKLNSFSVLFVTSLLIGAVYTTEVQAIETNKIYLYGEQHYVPKILEKELELWGEYYEQGTRHLFLELPYYTAEFLNQYMQADNNDILDGIYDTMIADGVPYIPENKEFFVTIKEDYPDTIFHGTDVGLQYYNIGVEYVDYLQKNNLTNTDEYILTLENIVQGIKYYQTRDNNYREYILAQNFIREMETVGDESVMGIYGSAHTNLSASRMAGKLYSKYGDRVVTTNLTYLAPKNIEIIRTDNVIINDKPYKAFYFGEQDLTNLTADYISRKFWRIENSFLDFADAPKNGQILPYSNYPMSIEKGQVFLVQYLLRDGTIQKMYFRSDEDIWDGEEVTTGFCF